MNKKQNGFTLIELMIVIAILGILASIAIPAYQDYAIRAKVIEGMVDVAPAKQRVAEFHQDRASFPTYRTSAGFGRITSKYVTVITMAAGAGPSGNVPIYIDINEAYVGAPVDIHLCLDPHSTGQGGTDYDCFVATDPSCAGMIPSGSAIRLVPSDCRREGLP